MTLEDFFTLTEMKDGLTAPSRVHELVAVMQKEKDCVVKNVGDATRQWAAVASTIAATENKDCLDLFILLDGLWFFDRWLKDTQKYGNDTTDDFVAESLTALLRAVEKLQIDKERSVSSGIWITVNNLLDHSSSCVQDRARALFASWKQGEASDTSNCDVQSASEKNGEIEHAVDVSHPIGNANTETEPSMDENLKSKSSNCLQPEDVKEEIQTCRNMDDSSPDHQVTAVEGTPLTVSCSFSIPKGDNNEPELDDSKKLSCSSDNVNAIASPSCKVEPGLTSPSADATIAMEKSREQALQNNFEVKDSDFGLNSSLSSDVGKSVSPSKSEGDDAGMITHLSKQGLDTDRKLENPEDMGTFSQMVDIGDDEDDDREHSSDGADDLRDNSAFTAMDTHISYPAKRSRSDIELEYGIVDALEVARQVAQEVEREVVDDREPSCSSSDEIMESDIRQPGSPDSINANQDLQMKELQNVPTGQNRSAEGSATEVGRSTSSNNAETEAENGTHELESSQVTEVAPEAEVNAEKGLCGFDLNQEVYSDDVEHTVNPISTPISVVSASRPAVTSGSPSAPLQFEGILGWKGSAATSAFRPASTSKTSGCEKTLEVGGTSNSSKQRQDSLDFDLNVAEDGDGRVMDLMSGRPLPVSSCLHFGESSLEVGTRRSERPNLDLNRLSDEGDAPPSSLRMEGKLFYSRNGHHSSSPASSSSMQPLLRNFDLNDRPLFHGDSSGQTLYLGNQNVNAFVGSKPGDPVISIMGTRVEVGTRAEVSRKDFLLQSPLPNGKPLYPVMDANLARMGGVLGIPAMSYTHSPVFGYNGLTTAPAMSLSPAVCGPGSSIPYMVDARAAPLVPQILSTPSAVAPYSQSSFIMTMGGPPSMNGAGPSRPNFDLNSGFPGDGGSAGGLRQLFMPSQSRTIEDQLRATAQPSSSGVGSKRWEPDGGWEPYPLLYKHPQPPWR